MAQTPTTEALQAEISHLRQQVQTLEHALERCQYMLTGSRDGGWDTNLRTGETYLSPRYKALLGYGPDELPDAMTTWQNLIHPDDATLAEQTFEAYLRGERDSYVLEHRLKHRNGEWRWMQARARIATRDAEGNPLRMAGTISDIDERKQLEESLRLFQFAMDNLSDGIHRLGPDGRNRYVNQSLCNRLGYTRDELLAMTLDQIDPDVDIEQWHQTIWPMVKEQGALTFEARHQTKDGRIFPVEINANYLAFEGQEHVFVFARDITEQKQAAEALQLFKLLVENSPDGIGVADLEGNFQYANPAYQQMTGYGEALIGMPVGNLLPSDSIDVSSIISHVLESDSSWIGETYYLHQRGHLFPVQASVFVARDDSGQVLGIPAIVRDISNRKQQEEELRMFQALVENASDAIAVVRPEDGTISYVNAAYRNLYRCQDEYLGQSIGIIVTEQDQPKLSSAMQEIYEQGIWTGILTHVRQDGTTFPAAESCFTVKDDAGNIVHVVGFVRDISDQIRQEEERTALQQQIIDVQRAALRELSTPLIPITESVVIMPLIGTIDTQRAQQVLETLLEGVSEHRAQLAILDITGVSIVDTQVAQALISAAQAVRLLGAQVMLTGIQPQIAQTLVHLGVDLSGIITRGSLQSGIAAALHHLTNHRPTAH